MQKSSIPEGSFIWELSPYNTILKLNRISTGEKKKQHDSVMKDIDHGCSQGSQGFVTTNSAQGENMQEFWIIIIIHISLLLNQMMQKV